MMMSDEQKELQLSHLQKGRAVVLLKGLDPIPDQS